VLLGVVIAGALSAGLVLRARRVLEPWQLLLFCCGLLSIVVAAFGLEEAINEADNSLGSTELTWQWSFWLGLGGVALLVGAFGWWWVAQRRAVRSPQSSAATAPSTSLVQAAGPLDWLVVALLSVGGLIVGVGWIAAMLLLWTSRAWTYREKLVASIGVPGGAWVVVIPIDEIGNRHWPIAAKVPLLLLTVPLLFVPSVAAVWLGLRAWDRRRSIGVVTSHTPSPPSAS